MSKNKVKRTTARERENARKARRIVNGIFIGLIILMILVLLLFYFLIS